MTDLAAEARVRAAVTSVLLVPTNGRPLTQNAAHRAHPRTVSAARAQYRLDTAVRARAMRIPKHLGRVHIIAQGVYTGGRLPDTDAIAPTLKGCLDGLVDAGVIPDDTPTYVARVSYDPPSIEDWTGIRLTIEEAP